MKQIIYLLLLVLITVSCTRDTSVANPEEQARQINETILKGWNTWDNRSILTQVLLPEELALVLKLKDGASGNILPMAFTGNSVPGSEKVRTIAHTPDGSYTDFILTWKTIHIRVQSVSEYKNLYLKVSQLDENATDTDELMISNDFFYNKRGRISIKNNQIITETGDENYVTQFLQNKGKATGNKGLSANLDGNLFITCGESLDTSKINDKIQKAADNWKEQMAFYGQYAESYNALQNVINWSVVYDPVNKQPVIPVARPWSYGWGEGNPGGWIRFCWDNFFVAYMQSLNSRELAFSEAIEMCNYVDKYGFVPNFIAPNNLASRDRSQPPVGSMMIREIYKAHPEKWFLEKTFHQLLKWNRWWKDNRDQNGYLAWGSTPFISATGNRREKVQNDFQAASYESGLDNTPMHDGVPFDTTIHMLLQGDVGLMGLYVGDCEALADIAAVLSYKEEEKELRERADYYRKKIQTMWDDDFGLFLNKRTDTGEFNRRISPTNFYVLIAKAATQDQAERMIREHFYNPAEFWGDYIMPSTARNDTAYTGEDYWRGSIWAPMNFLVYFGIRNYDLPSARKDLSEKSGILLMNEWLTNGFVRENYNAETGGAPSGRSADYYHWGALLGMINLIEEGYVPPPEQEIGN